MAFFSLLFLMIIGVWNCRVAASSNFLRAFKEYNRIYKPQIFCLVEPRISGHSANNVCKQLGYDN